MILASSIADIENDEIQFWEFYAYLDCFLEFILDFIEISQALGVIKSAFSYIFYFENAEVMIVKQELKWSFGFKFDVFYFIKSLRFELIFVLAINISVPISENHAELRLQLFLVLTQFQRTRIGNKLKILSQPQTNVLHLSIWVLAIEQKIFIFVNSSVAQFVHFMFEGSRQWQQFHLAKLFPKRLHYFLDLFEPKRPSGVAKLAYMLL